ncbi:hypothetical protein MNB_SV-9-1528 [hydrothermal vent metagenome]|uniref:YlxR domain-containing protein n=1 Tax=hydrothermal vent metagenome TaxID=652676 RepID=A0A1W1BG42_9ZZZZ
MVRLQQKENKILTYQGSARSFYLCYECINNEKKIRRLSKRFKEEFKQFSKFLKELVENG